MGLQPPCLKKMAPRTYQAHQAGIYPRQIPHTMASFLGKIWLILISLASQLMEMLKAAHKVSDFVEDIL
jgi:hypothetical protein